MCISEIHIDLTLVKDVKSVPRVFCTIMGFVLLFEVRSSYVCQASFNPSAFVL